ncbi:MucR family transcriptional regulator [Aliihoeflea aestuarii]|jgi:predicted transcriptional regulator|uniref:MucR family transcriptional regulator n=1 Tax=Aliihoeflea aestuarii TaxID=453840 RepID=UPI0020936485|nr:MucR family transcriptional regulator [Aliihoeflea aestuarii]MCO6390413.1 MucR family transcriptional regulator [Aliihoeflea aestuarii]
MNEHSVGGRPDEEHLLELTTQIVCAYVSHNPVPASEVPGLIGSVHQSISSRLGAVSTEPAQEPAVPVKKSVTPDYIISLEDGRKFRTLSRHLMARYGLTPEQYRRKWGLPDDYPMVAPNYAVERSKIAKSMGLGRPDAGSSDD